MNLDILTLGETMLRYSAPASEVLEQATRFEVRPAGAESNVAVTASRLGLQAGWISRLPNNPLGRLTANTIQQHGVDTSRVVWADDARMGCYYIDFGVQPRSANVIYDRANSAVTELSVDDVDWDYVASIRLFHVTGITLALSASLREVVDKAIAVAKDKGVLVSFDINYRAKLWSPEEARKVIEPLLSKVDILRGGLHETRLTLGKDGDSERVAKTLYEKYQPQVVVITDDDRKVVAFDGDVHERIPYKIEVVDPIGAGDAFTAGFLTGYLESGVEQGLDFGVALGALKHTYAGDIVWCTREDVINLIDQRRSEFR